MIYRNTLTITFDSDWTIGSGAGIPGSVDRQVLRDTDGLPYIPGKTLTGILRDAAEFVERHSPADAKHMLTKHVKELFGHQPNSHGGAEQEETSPAKLSIRPARLPEALRRELAKCDNRPVRDALFFTQPHVQIDNETGRTKDEHLFFLELVRGGLTLTSEIDCDGLTHDQEKFLVRVVKAVRRMGGNRRRGAGRCDIKLGTWEPPAGQPAAEESKPENSKPEESLTPKDGSWKVVPLEVALDEMVQIHRAVLGNIVEGLDFIPGSIMLPVIFERLKQAGVNESDLRKAVGLGAFQVSDFTPLIEGRPAMPVPNAFFQEKVEKKTEMNTGHLYNRLISSEEKPNQLRGLRMGWALPSGDSLQYAKGDDLLTMRMHNTIEDDVQRPTEKVGGVYSYEALQRGLRFGGEIRIGHGAPAISETQLDALPGSIRIGRSRKDDYGAATLSFRQNHDSAESGTSKEDTQDNKTRDLKEIVVLLESDVLVRNESLALSGDPRDLGRMLGTQLGVPLEPMESDSETIASIGRARRRESWHVGWKLPRPSLVGLQGGSVYRYKIAEGATISAADLSAIEASSIGERRAEGFGRIRINPPFLQHKSMNKTETKISRVEQADHGNLDTGRPTILHELRVTAFRRDIQRRARQVAFGDDPKFFGLEPAAGPEKATQWGSLRTAAARAGDTFDEGRRPLQQWVDSRLLVEGNASEDPWPKSRCDKWKGMRGKIKELVENEENVWGLLSPIATPYLDTDEENLLRSELWGFAVRALIDATCEAAIKRCQRKESKKQSGTPGTQAAAAGGQ